MFTRGGLWLGLLSAALLPQCCMAAAAQDQSNRNPAQGKPELEMVFVLDTTGSMEGLIDGAKTKIWSIVNDVMKAPQHPKVRIGLVAYRDHGDAYVTKVQPITEDLDKVYATLMEYKADGGGDTPEDVRKALSDGVRRAGWSKRGPNVAQILFLVGDAPPHDDYSNEPDTLLTAAEAVKAGLVVNTIECGSDNQTQSAWQKISRRGEGQFFQIDQNGGVQAITTPFDSELSNLGTKIGNTYWAYGGRMSGGGGMAFRAAKAKKQATLEHNIAVAAPRAASADRAANKAINSQAYDSDDLIQSIENGARLESVRTEDLPTELQKLAPDARKREVDKRIAERSALRAKILDLSKKRDAYILAERKKKGGSKASAFDVAVSAALRAQAARHGIHF